MSSAYNRAKGTLEDRGFILLSTFEEWKERRVRAMCPKQHTISMTTTTFREKLKTNKFCKECTKPEGNREKSKDIETFLGHKVVSFDGDNVQYICRECGNQSSSTIYMLKKTYRCRQCSLSGEEPDLELKKRVVKEVVQQYPTTIVARHLLF